MVGGGTCGQCRPSCLWGLLNYNLLVCIGGRQVEIKHNLLVCIAGRQVEIKHNLLVCIAGRQVEIKHNLLVCIAGRPVEIKHNLLVCTAGRQVEITSFQVLGATLVHIYIYIYISYITSASGFKLGLVACFSCIHHCNCHCSFAPASFLCWWADGP